MKKLISLSFAFVIIASLFIGCKKGENDPFLSLMSRKARLTGVWNLTSADYQEKNVYTDDNTTVTTVTDYTYDGTIMTADYGDEEDTYAYSEKVTINKDGTFEMIVSEEEEYWDSGEYKTGTEVTTVLGVWYFLDGNKDIDLKNKERVEFLVESLTVDFADPDWENYSVDYSGASNSFVYIFVLDKLANKEIVALLDYKITDDDGDYEQETGTKTYTQE